MTILEILTTVKHFTTVKHIKWSLSKHKSVVSKNVYPQRHSLSFGHSFYRPIFLLKTKV